MASSPRVLRLFPITQTFPASREQPPCQFPASRYFWIELCQFVFYITFQVQQPGWSLLHEAESVVSRSLGLPHLRQSISKSALDWRLCCASSWQSIGRPFPNFNPARRGQRLPLWQFGIRHSDRHLEKWLVAATKLNSTSATFPFQIPQIRLSLENKFAVNKVSGILAL